MSNRSVPVLSAAITHTPFFRFARHWSSRADRILFFDRAFPFALSEQEQHMKSIFKNWRTTLAGLNNRYELRQNLHDWQNTLVNTRPNALLAFSPLCAVWQFVRNRFRVFESALVWKHREYHRSSIGGAQAKHRAGADIRPAKEFLRKEYADAPHLFRDQYQSRPLARYRFSHLILG
jgi:hypothetical protein